MKTVIKKRTRINQTKSLELSKKINLSPMIIEFLCDKGYDDEEKINNFINFKEKDLRKVSKMKDALPFLQRLANAIIKKENIVIYGDYDSDGVCATAIFIWTLRWLGIEANYFISNRFTEGYGLSVKGMERLLNTYPETNLIVTCDNGIVAFDGIEYAKSRGVEVIVSDHHTPTPDGKLPNCPVVCEKRLDEDQTKCEHICGAELARRLCFALTYGLKKYDELKQRLKYLYMFSAFATISDVIPLNAANHYVVKKGLELINSNNTEIFCFDSLCLVSEYYKEIDESTIGYRFSPMVNAAGRITGSADIAVDLFINPSLQDTRILAQKLFDLNTIRQDESFKQQQLAVEEYNLHKLDKYSFIVLYGLDERYYNEGIAGLIASYMVENYRKPCICLAKKENSSIYKGSARSIEGFNIKTVLDNCNDLLLGYGGHPMAAGLSVEQSNLEKLINQLNYYAQNTTELIETIEIDYYATPNNFSIEMMDEYKKILAPFGPNFEKPIYATSGTFDSEIKVMKDKHIKTKLTRNNESIDLIWFNSVNQYQLLNPNEQSVLVVGQPTMNEYKGRMKTQFNVERLFLIPSPNKQSEVNIYD